MAVTEIRRLVAVVTPSAFVFQEYKKKHSEDDCVWVHNLECVYGRRFTDSVFLHAHENVFRIEKIRKHLNKHQL